MPSPPPIVRSAGSLGVLPRRLDRRPPPGDLGLDERLVRRTSKPEAETKSVTMQYVQYVEANGARIPAIGLGTWDLRGDVCAEMVEQALHLGYRHIDTAEMYGNEEEVGEGLRASGLNRDEVFVTTKVWPDHLAPADLERATKDSLARLQLASVDLLLIHWPNPRIPLAGAISALCRMREAGFARNIGISNFTAPLIEEAVRLATAPLVTNQIEWHPFLDQSKVIAACRRHGLAVTAYSPIARGRAAGDATLERIGARHGKTAGQVSLRFLVQEGAIVIPRTSRPERLVENMAIFDFALDAAEMDEIRKLARQGGRVVDWSGAPAWD
jgi:2,5-diketo-D-gluconate reductase B